jgi:hypothetical protein
MRPVKEKKFVQSLLSKLFCSMKVEKKKNKNYVERVAAQELIPHQKKREEKNM